jgi:AcrR family transcriptional regulator
MSAIAERSGIAKGTIYLYFDSKLAIMEALVDSYYDMMVDALIPILSDSDSEKAIRNAVHAALELASRERDLVVLLDLRLGLTRKPEAIGNPRALKGIRGFLKTCQAKGQLRNYDPAIAALLVGGLVQWITKFCLIWQDEDIYRYEETAVRMLQYALFKDFSE